MEKSRLKASDPGNIFLSLFRRQTLNIYPTDHCNRTCVFCKMRGIQGGHAARHEMDIRALQKVISFSKRSGIKAFRILGGEPTQHPFLAELIEKIYSEGMSVEIIFTNGIFNNARLVDLIKERRIAVNFHYFPPDEYDFEELKLVRNNLCLLFGSDRSKTPGKKISNAGLRCMSIIFYKKDQDFRYLIDAALSHGVKEISWSFARPSLGKSNRHVRWDRLADLLPSALEFVGEAAKNGISTSIECPVTPCIFTARQLRFARQHIKDLSFTCEPILDVFPDLSVHYCMGLPIVGYIDETNSLQDILADQLFRSQILRFRPRSPSCEKCRWRRDGQCQGYCLQYKCRPEDFRGGWPLNGLEWRKVYSSC